MRTSRSRVLWQPWDRIPVLFSKNGQDWNPIPRARRGFTVAECLAALAILVVVVAVMTEVTVGSLLEQRRNSTRQRALESAANILEAAQACDWDALTADWGKAQRLPDSVSECLNEGKLEVTVEPEPARPQTRRITVEINWLQDGKPTRSVKLVGLRSARTMPHPGGKP